MRTSYFYSLIFALMASASIAATATPAPPAGETGDQRSLTTQESRPGQIDLNHADAATLQRELAGIGKAKAEAIVAYRETNGLFSSVDELLEVKGIGKAILERNRDKLDLN
ncbi:competence protein ComEA [Pseudomonas sp. EB276 TE3739]|uniref:ComEA family DNA-binding protein n=1 Tax=Pseudomonas TaxID=286 RepID=UPI0020A01443|nr:helix-hairpin-helix domain-containing protein [Pseudomonas koreensis]MCP1477244.1 competence protein ComEA [Pseudomonas koreensis]